MPADRSFQLLPVTALSKLINSDPKLEAVDSIRGFDWQRWLTVERWLELKAEDRLWIEWGEDVTVVRENDVETIQAKDLAAKISLGQAPIQKIISRALTRGIGVTTTLWTTASVTMEKAKHAFGEPGLHYWTRILQGQGDALQLRDYLLGIKNIAESAKKVLRDTQEADLPALFGKVVWITGEGDLSNLRARIEPKIETRLVETKIANAAGLRTIFADALFALVGRAAVQPVVDDRVLTRVELDQVIQRIYGSFLDAGRPETVAQTTRLIDEHIAGMSSVYVDQEIEQELRKVRRSRYFVGYGTEDAAEMLANRILEGNLRNGSGPVKGRALSWAARLLPRLTIDRRRQLIASADAWSKGEELEVNRAFLTSDTDGLETALSDLAKIASSAARSAGLRLVGNKDGYAGMCTWLERAQLTIDDLDEDGKFYFLNGAICDGKWDEAITAYSTLSEKDFSEIPALTNIGGLICLAKAVPNELRRELLNGVPQNSAHFDLSGDDAGLSARSDAVTLFERCETQCRDLGLEEIANLSAEFALWLRLLAPDTKAAALEKLKSGLTNPETGLRLIKFAFQFDVHVDVDAVQREIDRQLALTGGKSPDALYAEFLLALYSKSDADMASYVADNQERLSQALNPLALTLVEVHALAGAGFADRLEDALKRLEAQEPEEAVLVPLKLRLAELKGADPVTTRKAEYEESGGLFSLRALIKALLQRKDFRQAAKYARVYFDTAKSVEACEIYAECLDRIKKDKELHELLQENSSLVSQSIPLRWLWSICLYRRGDLKNASAFLKDLRAEGDCHQYRDLSANIAQVSGDWEALSELVEEAWRERANAHPVELFFAAKLALASGSTRVGDLLKAVATAHPDDANALLTAYSIAVEAGLETEESAQWFARAVELSSEGGPIRRFSLDELVEMAPASRERQNTTWSQVREGKLPLFAAAQMANTGLGNTFLLRALTNERERDVRRKAVLYAYSGQRQLQSISAQTIAFDGVALLTMELLGIVDDVLESFDKVYLPHATLGWLFEERSRIQFHQPRRIRDAQAVLNLIGERKLKTFASTTVTTPALIEEVGIDLAEMLTEAALPGGEARYVVSTTPVYKNGSLMKEEADLSNFRSVLVSCAAVVDRLVTAGVLTGTESEFAYSYLSTQGPRWPDEPIIDAPAIVYLDNVAVSYLHHLNLLPKLAEAGIEAYVARDEATEIAGLLQHKSTVEAATGVINSLRKKLSSALESGRVELGQRPRESGKDIAANPQFPHSQYRVHPTVGIIDVVSLVDAVVADDRFLNAHYRIASSDKTNVPLFTTVDLLDSLATQGRLTSARHSHCLAKLRRQGYMFVPLSSTELKAATDGSTFKNDAFAPSAELRAVRDNLLQARCASALLLPDEAQWLTEATQTVTREIKAQWGKKGPSGAAKAVSHWLYQMIDLADWAGCFREGTAGHMAGLAPFHALSLLQPASDLSAANQDQYRTWVMDAIVGPMKEGDPQDYERFLAALSENLRFSATEFLD